VPDGICSVEDCSKPSRSPKFAWCGMHYERLRRLGSTDAPPRRTAEQRFWPKVNKHGPIPKHRPDLGPCWIWTGNKATRDYGVFRMPDGHLGPAHHFSYELLVGPIPAGLELDHLCRNHPCVNPIHLEAVTHLENMRRGFWAQRTRCKWGHELTEDNVYPTGRHGLGRGCRTCRRINSKRHSDIRSAARRARRESRASTGD
jgi:hypothetical protein